MIERRRLIAWIGAIGVMQVEPIARKVAFASSSACRPMINSDDSPGRVIPMAGLCPTLGFQGAADIYWMGQPQIGHSIALTAFLHNLSPNSYYAQPGQVEFRWVPPGWTGDYCSTPLLTVAPGSNNPCLAIDSHGIMMVPPGGNFPATIAWTPGASDVGTGPAKGSILCRAITLDDGQCPPFNPPDCGRMPYNLKSGRVNVLAG